MFFISDSTAAECVGGVSPSHATQARDTSDVGVELPNWRRVPGALHFVMLHENLLPSDYLNFMFRMFVVRRYQPRVWQRLVPSIPAAGEPHWKLMLHALAEAYRLEDKIFHGNYRPCTLRGHARSKQKHEREEHTLRLLYRALPTREIQDFASTACPRTFGVMYDKLHAELASLPGVFGDYGIKLMLDMLVLLGAVPPAAISRWPVACPGYTETLAVVFPGLPAALHLQALYWVHRDFGKTWRFQFPESCAQLCWDHRRGAGILPDRLEWG